MAPMETGLALMAPMETGLALMAPMETGLALMVPMETGLALMALGPGRLCFFVRYAQVLRFAYCAFILSPIVLKLYIKLN